MYQQTTGLRQQDIVVVNPQTGEVLGGNKAPSQPVLLTKNDIDPKGNETLPGGDGKPPVVNGSGSSGNRQRQSTGGSPTGTHSQGGSGMGGGSGPSGGTAASNATGSNERMRQVYTMADCQMTNLTVYLDRALVSRRIKPRFNSLDITEVLFEHISPAIDKDSIR